MKKSSLFSRRWLFVMKIFHYSYNLLYRDGGMDLRRAIYFLIFLLSAVVLLFSKGVHNRMSAMNDYAVWEEQCLKEYRESQELFVFIDLTRKTLYLFKNHEQIMKCRIAIGAKESPSPIGIYRIISKDEWGKGFGGRWMGLNVPWGNYGIHGTTKPGSIGRAVSHGCIRLNNKDAEELYRLVKHGTTVEIYGGPFGPFGSGFRELRPGDMGADVMEVQRTLRVKGFYKGHISGHYSQTMERALNSFQKANGLPISNVIDKSLYSKMGIILTE